MNKEDRKLILELKDKIDCLQGKHKSGGINDIPGTNIFRCLRCGKQFLERGL